MKIIKFESFITQSCLHNICKFQRCHASLILREAPRKLYDFCVNRCTNFNASLIFGLTTLNELYTYDRNLPDSQTNPPRKYIEMVGISEI